MLDVAAAAEIESLMMTVEDGLVALAVLILALHHLPVTGGGGGDVLARVQHGQHQGPVCGELSALTVAA